MLVLMTSFSFYIWWSFQIDRKMSWQSYVDEQVKIHLESLSLIQLCSHYFLFIAYSLCHKSNFNPSRMVNVILLLNLSYVIFISSYWCVPEIFIELFLRIDSLWWLKKSPATAKFTYSNLEAFEVHPPSYVIVVLKKMPFFITLLYPLPDKRPHWAAENLCILWK